MRTEPFRAPLRPGAARALRAAALAAAWMAAGMASASRATAEEIDGEPRFKSVGLQANPLDLILGRYSLDFEYLPAPHHALHGTAFYEYALPGTDDQLTGFGGEVGYRFYSGDHGPQGFFAGASFLVAELEYVHGNPVPIAYDHANDTQYVQLGGALDVGYQLVFQGNFALGAGVGVQYTADTIAPQFEYTSHPWEDLAYGAGLRPRALLQVGAAF